jgi:hypothetical protein
VYSTKAAMTETRWQQIFHYLVAAVWLINGVWCKVLNQVPRHESIVKKLIAPVYYREFTIAIGISETLLALWLLSGLYRRFNYMLQIVLIVSMNMIEYIFAKELLLFGHYNLMIAIAFTICLYWIGVHKRVVT